MKIKKLDKGFLIEYSTEQFGVSNVDELLKMIGEIYNDTDESDALFKVGDVVECNEYFGGVVELNLVQDEGDTYPYRVNWYDAYGTSCRRSDAYTYEGEWGVEDAGFGEGLLNAYRLRKKK